MKAVISTKTRSSYIETADSRLVRSDREGSVVAGSFSLLANAVRTAMEGEVIYVSRFLYKILKSRVYDFWLSGSFKDGTPLSSEEMDAVIDFTMLSGANVSFRNIDQYALADVPGLEPELGILVTEVVSTRADWTEGRVISKDRELIAPVTDRLTANEEVVGLMLDYLQKEAEEIEDEQTEIKEETEMSNIKITIENSTSKKEEVIAEKPVAAIGDFLENDDEFAMAVQEYFTQASPKLEEPAPVQNTVKISLGEEPKKEEPKKEEIKAPSNIRISLSGEKTGVSDHAVTLDKTPVPKKASDVQNVSLRLDGDKTPTFLVDPFEDEVVTYVNEPSAYAPSGFVPPVTGPSSAEAGRVDLSGVSVTFVSAVSSPVSKPSSAVSSSVFADFAARRKVAR